MMNAKWLSLLAIAIVYSPTIPYLHVRQVAAAFYLPAQP